MERICKNCKNYENIKKKCLKRTNETLEENDDCSIYEQRDISLELKDCYYTIIDILKKYCDLEERYYPIISLWIIGTYAHDNFDTFPYLFLNATKGSGKSRLLKLISTLSKNGNGNLTTSLTQSVLFRTAKQRTFCIDELENLEGDYFANLRDLLNSAYKKGGIVERSIKRKNGEYEVEKFDVFCPIAMANISGMESVLGDRCITLVLEKSINPKITKRIENYSKNTTIQKIKGLLENISSVFCSLIIDTDISQYWNDYLDGNLGEDNKNIPFFKKVNDMEIQGRDLELLFPLYFIAYLIDAETLEKILEISKEIVKEREEEDYFENRDKLLLRFLSDKIKEGNLAYLDYVSTSYITNQFREYENENNEWINSKWIGKALKRMKLIKDKKREKQGIKVLLNADKIKV